MPLSFNEHGIARLFQERKPRRDMISWRLFGDRAPNDCVGLWRGGGCVTAESYVVRTTKTVIPAELDFEGTAHAPPASAQIAAGQQIIAHPRPAP
jgi:hypothetical protein